MLQVPAFSARHRTVIFDNRDVGRSSMADGRYEIADMARDTLALADALELDSFHLLGLSMGGAIAQELALAAPERVRTLTLAVTFPAGGAWARKLGEVWAERVEQAHARGAHRRADAAHFSERFFENAEGMRLAARDDARQPPSAADRRVRAPARGVRPPRRARPPADAARADARDRRRVRHARAGLEVEGARGADPRRAADRAAGCPHGANVERAEEFNRSVLDFIAQRAPAPA